LLKSLFESFEVDDKGYNPKSSLEVELHPGNFYTTVQLDEEEVMIFQKNLKRY